MQTKQRTDWLRPLGRSGLTVSAVAAGGAPIGGMPEIFGYDVDAEQAVRLVVDLLDSPIRVIDTSNGYSAGESERRIGRAIVEVGGLPADYLIATKVDGKDGDYSGERVRQSMRESTKRLGLDRLPLVYLHDPEFALDEGLDAPGGAVEALVELQARGVIGALGVAGGDVGVMRRFLDLGVFDVLLSHNRWTLVDRSADELFDLASARGIGVVNAAYLGGGLLANPQGSPTYGYRPAKKATVAAAQQLGALCREWNTDLPTAALQFSLRDPRIHMSVVGISKPERIQRLLDSANVELPDQFWTAVDDLLPDPSNWLDFEAS